MLVSLISRLVACSPRIVVDKQTDGQTDRHTARCACAPRVNERDVTFGWLQKCLPLIETAIANYETAINLKNRPLRSSVSRLL